MQQRMDDEDDRIENAQKEMEEKNAAEEQKKMEKNHKWQKDIASHRNQQVHQENNEDSWRSPGEIFFSRKNSQYKSTCQLFSHK